MVNFGNRTSAATISIAPDGTVTVTEPGGTFKSDDDIYTALPYTPEDIARLRAEYQKKQLDEAQKIAQKDKGWFSELSDAGKNGVEGIIHAGEIWDPLGLWHELDKSLFNDSGKDRGVFGAGLPQNISENAGSIIFNVEIIMALAVLGLFFYKK